MNIKKLFIGLAVVAVAFGVVVSANAQALTAEQIIAALTANPALLSQLTGLLGGASTPAAVTSAPVAPLTMGSKGAQVTALQNFLLGQGIAIPAGATGYFGAQTRDALKAFQVANGVTPAAGYYGNLTAAAVAAKLATVTPGTTLPAGCTSTTGYSSTTGAKCDGTTGSTGTITTPGAEGILTVTTNPTPSSGLTIREGDAKKAVLGLKLEAKLSDIAIQRVKVDLGSSTVIYNKLFSKIYLMDGSTVVAESDLNSSTVIKDGTTYYITLTGFNVIVPKGGTKVLTLALDAKSSIETTYEVSTYGLAIPIDGVRGVDGAGLTQAGPATALTRRTVTIDADAIVDSASMTISKASSNPTAATVVASDGSSNNEKDGVTFLVFDVKAKKDNLLITDLAASISKTGAGAATATTAYLYEAGNTDPVGSATISATNGYFTFADIDYTVPADSTKTLTIKADIRSADITAAVLTASTTYASFTVENSDGTAIVPTGSATGEAMTVKSAGAEITLVSKTPTVSTTFSDAGISTSTVSASFTVNVKALGKSILLGKQASTSPMFASSTTYFKVYNGDTALSIVPTVSFSLPESDMTISGETGTLPEDGNANVTVTVSFSSRTSAGALQTGLVAGSQYSFGMEAVGYDGNLTSTFMAGKSAWRTTPAVVN